MVYDQARYAQVLDLIDAANAADPHRELNSADGKEHPKELLYGIRMSGMLERFAPDASEAVRIAVRAQHIQRWKFPRADFPKTPFGYKQWRTRLYKFHADTAGQLMQQVGYDGQMIARVQKIVGKLGIKVNPETQLLEDVANMVFIEHYLTGFAAQHPEYDKAKWIDILQKTWKKMSPAGQAFTLSSVRLPAALAPLILEAVGEPSASD